MCHSFIHDAIFSVQCTKSIHLDVVCGALEYESDGHVPTGELKQGAFNVGFRRKKKGVTVCGIQKKKKNGPSLV